LEAWHHATSCDIMRHRAAGRESGAAGRHSGVAGDTVVQPEDAAGRREASGVAGMCSGTAEDIVVRRMPRGMLSRLSETLRNVVGWRWESRQPGDCKGNPLCFRLPPAFRFRFRLPPVFRFCSRHLVSLPQCLWSHDIVRHPLPTRFPSDPPSAYDTLTQHICRTLHVFTNFGLISYIHYFVY